MSLINKMLQDLDARGTTRTEALPGQVKPVARAPYRLNRRAIVAAAGGAVVGTALAWVGWTQWHRAAQPALAVQSVVVQPAAVAAKPAVKAAPVVTGPVQAARAPASPAAPVAAAVTAPAAAPVVAQPSAAPADADDAQPMSRAERRAERKRRAAERKAERLAQAAAVHPKDVAPMEPDSEEAREARRAMAQVLAMRGKSAQKSSAALVAAARAAAQDDHAARPRRAPQDRQETGAQRAEGEYRRALASLQEGRMTETVAALEQALKYEPAHEAARQTLVGLLIEAGRTDEAMRQLQPGLTLDPRQPAMAMLLARLQIERGGNGIDTLMRTLPYAGNDPDYRAFLAAALARQQRHREAAEQYQQAVRAVPGNGVWWMGLGISLQAEKRNGEALDAFQKARASGGLTQELQAFVERRIQQLGR
ncbi:MAG: tetratricopeptide repeat protein [Massilia sp.]|nr:tetratricopeptide repeat protein [Massilia sp.]